MARKGKRAAYVEYALFNKAKYERITGKRNIGVSELINLASSDWSAEDEQTKDFFKAVAKGDAAVTDYRPRHETSCQRLDTEAPVIVDMSIGTKASEIKKKITMTTAKNFRETLNIREIMDKRFGIIDFMSYVDYGDGLCVPAEFGISTGNLRMGVEELYSEIIGVNPRKLRPGFANEAKITCERQHGIDIFGNGRQSASLDTFYNDLTSEMPKDTLFLCRSEDVNTALGCWFWLRDDAQLDMPDLKLMTIEDFISIITNHLMSDGHGQLQASNLPSTNQLTELLSKPTYDLEKTFRCEYHNNDEDAWNKSGCSRKNVKKYFYLVAQYLSDFLDIQLVNGRHYYKDESVKGKVRRNHTPPPNHVVPPNSRQEEQYAEPVKRVPRKPTNHSYSADKKGSPSGSSQCSGYSTPLDPGVEPTTPAGATNISQPRLPRKPKALLNNCSNDCSKDPPQKTSVSYEPIVLKSSAPSTGYIGCGRARLRGAISSKPDDVCKPGSNPLYGSVSAVVIQHSLPPASQGSFGRGSRAAAARTFSPPPPGHSSSPPPPGHSSSPPPGYTFKDLPEGLSSARLTTNLELVQTLYKESNAAAAAFTPPPAQLNTPPPGFEQLPPGFVSCELNRINKRGRIL